MKLTTHPAIDLTYCTNIHPGNGWSEVMANLQSYAPALKARLSPDGPFGLGLRLSARESEELLLSRDRPLRFAAPEGRGMEADPLLRLRDFLAEHGYYVALLNGFPYGSFHRRAIKEDVFAPDWRDEKRVQYTLRLVEILAALLPEGMEGGISTSPLSYKRWVAPNDRAAWESMTRNVVRVAEALVRARRRCNQFIHLDIEPEPDGLIENSAELVAFYQNWLLPVGAPLLAGALRVPLAEAQEYLREHIQVCLDTCHVAVEYEAPAAVLARFEQAGIRIGRLQISSALRVPLPPGAADRRLLAQQLAPFAESSYLHQVIERREDGTLHHYRDLEDALPAIQEPPAREWRIHFHVPLFMESYGMFGSTQEEIRQFLCMLDFTRHLEIETYTWEVLPPVLKLELLDSIDREYRWMLAQLAPAARAVPALAAAGAA